MHQCPVLRSSCTASIRRRHPKILPTRQIAGRRYRCGCRTGSSSSGWLQHAPFAFWLTQAARPRSLVELGVYRGFSYLAFCQAVHELGLNTNCYGVDTWEGDEHAGFYGPEVLLRLKDYHDSRYGGFSQLIQSTFADALDYFEDRSIDLLHIDGRHFYEDVRDDFEVWQAKLSKSAVVLLHDTNVREKDFGVWRLWQELASDYPSFEFKHGHGLGVLAVGKDIPAPLRPLFFGSETSCEKIRQFYARLGSTVAERLELGSARDAIAVRDDELNFLRGEVKARAEAFLALEAEIDRLRSKVVAEQAPLASEVSALRAEVGGKAGEILNLRSQLESRDKAASALQAEIIQKANALAAAQAELTQKASELSAAQADLTQKAGELSAAQAELNQEGGALSAAQAELTQKGGALSALQARCEALQSRAETVEGEFARKVDEIGALKTQLEASEARNAALQQDVAREAQALSSAQAELATRRDHIGVLETEAARRSGELSALQDEIEALKASNAALEREVVRRDENLDAAKEEMSDALSRLNAQVEVRDSRIAVVEAELTRKVEDVARLEAELRANERQAEALLDTHRVAKARAMAVSLGQVRSRDQQIAMLHVELRAQREQTRREIADVELRFLAKKAEADETLERSAAAIHARDNAIAALREELAAQDLARDRLTNEIVEIRQGLSTWQAVSREREQQLAEAHERLSAIDASTSWRLTSPLRGAVLAARGLSRSVKGLANILRRQRPPVALPAPQKRRPRRLQPSFPSSTAKRKRGKPNASASRASWLVRTALRSRFRPHRSCRSSSSRIIAPSSSLGASRRSRRI